MVVRPSPYLTFSTGGGVKKRSEDNLVSSGGTVFFQGKGEGTGTFGYLQVEWTPGPAWRRGSEEISGIRGREGRSGRSPRDCRRSALWVEAHGP